MDQDCILMCRVLVFLNMFIEGNQKVTGIYQQILPAAAIVVVMLIVYWSI